MQHERGPRKPKLQHLQGANGPPGHHHLPVSFVNTSSYNHVPHFTTSMHPNAFQVNAMLHHPQPLSFAPLHSMQGSLMQPIKLEQSKFDFIMNSQNPQMQPQVIQPVKMEQSKLGPPFEFTSNTAFYKPTIEHLPPSPTTSKSSISVDSPSEGLISPQSTIDCGTSVLSPTPIAASTMSLPSPPQNGLLDILMSSDKCQEFMQYQFHSSLMFPPFASNTSANIGADGLSVRLPTWEVLQETTARLLFMAVRWVRCLLPFQTLSKNDQQLLLQVKKL